MPFGGEGVALALRNRPIKDKYVLYLGKKETIKRILIVWMKNKREINNTEMFFSTLRPFKLMLSSECD